MKPSPQSTESSSRAMLLTIGAFVILASSQQSASAGDPPRPKSIQLTGIVRDFIEHTKPGGHPDFEVTPSLGYALYEMNIDPNLGEDANPVFIGGGKKVNTQWRTSSLQPICYTLYNPNEPYFDLNAVLGGASSGGIQSADSFNQWFNNVPDVNLWMPLTITLNDVGDKYVFDDKLDPQYESLGGFFPIDNILFGNSGGFPNHNFHFTYEIHTSFTYDAAAEQWLKFVGDDDVWIFIDGKLVLDLGSIHAAKEQYVFLDRLNLVDGEAYDFAFFYAERHRTQSNLRIETNIVFPGPQSSCDAVVGPCDPPPSWPGCDLVAKIASPEQGGTFPGVHSIAIDGNRAVIGGPFNSGQGSVFIYEKEPVGWILKHILHSTNPDVDVFGASVALQGDTLFVGDFLQMLQPYGDVYIYHFNGTEWQLQQTLNDPEPSFYDRFGFSLALQGDTAFVGDIGYSRVHVFKHLNDSWVHQQVLAPGDPNFAGAIAVSGDMLLVGASMGDWFDAGHAYLYVREQGTWMLKQQLSAAAPYASSNFGAGVGIVGGALLVGGDFSDADQFERVAVFTEIDGVWQLTQHINPPENEFKYFGRSIACEGDTVIIGAPREFCPNVFSSAFAYTHANGTFTLTQRLAMPDPCDADSYPVAVEVSADTAAILSLRHDLETGFGLVSGYAFDLTQLDCNANCISDALDIASGTSTDFNSNLVPDDCEPALVDINADGVIDIDDLMLVINDWGPCKGCSADVTGNGVVDIDDLLLVLNHWT